MCSVETAVSAACRLITTNGSAPQTTMAVITIQPVSGWANQLKLRVGSRPTLFSA